jgi:hypothetical protein
MSINAQPFSPTFKLVGTLEQDQILIFDASENAFVNAYGSGTGANTTPVTNVTDVGIGVGISYGVTGNDLELKSLIAGNNISIVDNGDALVISNTFENEIQTATNLGTGTAIFAQLSTNDDFEFKSLAVGNGLTISDDGSTVTVSLSGTVGQGTYLEIENNLSDLADVAAARLELDVYSKSETQAKFIRTDGHSVPDQNNMWDIGSSLRRFNDIYAETLQGTAVLSDNLTISGNVGDLLAYDGSKWIAVSPLGEGGASTAQILSLDGTTLTISGGNSVSLDLVEADIEGLTIEKVGHNIILDSGWSFVPQDNGIQSLGSPTNRWSEVYLSNASVHIDNNTLSSNGTELLWNGEPVSGIAGLTSDTESQTLTLNEGWNFVPATNILQDIGSPTNRFRDLYLSGNTIDIAENTLSIDAQSKLIYNGVEIFIGKEYANLINTPSTLSSFENDIGYITLADAVGQIQSDLANIEVSYDTLTNVPDLTQFATVDYVTTTLVTDYATTTYVDDALANIVGLAPETLDTLSELATAINNDPAYFTSVSSQLDSKVNSADLASIATTGSYNDLLDTPIATAVEYAKINYATDGSVISVSDLTGGITANVVSTAGGIIEFAFPDYSLPPANTMIYGYSYATNEYVITPITADMTTRKISGGGVAGAPTAFGNFGTAKMTLKLAEVDTGASRQFGTTTHAWVLFTLLA